MNNTKNDTGKGSAQCSRTAGRFLDIGYEEALRLALGSVQPLGEKTLAVDRAVGRILSRAVHAKVDSPSLNASLKDGYAVVSADIAEADPENPVPLAVKGYVSAGDMDFETEVGSGCAVRILSGAPVPKGADAVLSEEFVRVHDDHILAFADAAPGRNILERGSDVFQDEMLFSEGERLRPQAAGLVVAGGVSEVSVYTRPKIGLLATGSEVLPPGAPFEEGKLYASNLALQHAWFTSEGFDVVFRFSEDSKTGIGDAIQSLLSETDVVITSGGAWKGDRDLVVGVLDALGWNMLFHRVRMGPGKALGMGLFDQKPVFCLPGGPASNEAAFMMIVFPAVLRMAGCSHAPYLQLHGRLSHSVSGQSDWTQFIQCGMSAGANGIVLHPMKMKSRLAAMARTPAVVKIPEGVDTLLQDTIVPFVCLDRERFMMPIGYSGRHQEPFDR